MAMQKTIFEASDKCTFRTEEQCDEYESMIQHILRYEEKWFPDRFDSGVRKEYENRMCVAEVIGIMGGTYRYLPRVS